MDERYFAGNERTRDAIKNAVYKLIKEKDFDSISISDIIKEARISRATFYNYFEDKYDLKKCITDEFMIKVQDLDYSVYHDKTKKNKAAVDNEKKLLANFAKNHSDVLYFMNKNNGDNSIDFNSLDIKLNNPIYKFHYDSYLSANADIRKNELSRPDFQAHAYASLTQIRGRMGEQEAFALESLSYNLAYVVAHMLHISAEDLRKHLLDEMNK